MRFKKNDQQMLAEAYDEVHQGGYGNDLGSVTQKDITRMNQFVHNVLSNYAYSKELPEEFRPDLQSWVNTPVTSDNYDKIYSLIQNIRSQLPNTDIGKMIGDFVGDKSSQGTTTPFALNQSSKQSS